jgi:charged multivesicular body protein 7
MRAYQTSAATLKSILSHPSLQLSHVDSTMDALAEALADQQEIDVAIQSGGKAAVDAAGVQEADEGMLEKELAELMLDDKVEEPEKAKTEDKKVVTQEKTKVEVTPTPIQMQEASSPKADHHVDWAAIDEAARQRKEDEAIRASTEQLQKEQNRQALTAD